MPFIKTTDKTSLFYNDWGAGHPVVLIHGWPLDSDMWEYQAGFLAENGCRVIAYDRRGFGRSDQPWHGYDYNTLADDLKAILDGLELQNAILVGFSMGGGEVARYMSRHAGARVSKAVLISSVTPFLLNTADNPDGVDASVFETIIAGLKADRPHFLAGFGKQFFGAGLLNFAVTADIMHWASMLALRGSAPATLACARAFSATDFRTDMGYFRVPTLIMHGDADQTVPFDHSGRIAARMLPSAKLIEYPGAPHAVFFTEKEKLNQDLLEFIAS